MADKKLDLRSYYNDLTRLFKSGPIVKQRIATKIAAPGQPGIPVGTARAFLKASSAAYTNTLAAYGQYNRLARYSDYNEMESLAEIHSGLDIYADETCAKGDDGKIISIMSSNPQIKDALESLFEDTLNIEFNAWHWIRNMCKYGDQFLLVDHHPDYGVMNCLPIPINEIEYEQGYDKDDPMAYRYRWVTQGNRILEKWQVIHFRMLGNDNFLPYGMSVLEAVRRAWRQLVLMEDAVMVYRIVRSPERRVFYIDVGNISPQDVPAFMEKAKSQLKRNQVVDSTTGRVDLRYNPLSTDEDYFIPVRGGPDNSSRIDTLPGGQFTGDIDDLNYIQNKVFAGLKIPKSYLGYEGDVSSKATLSQEDVRFARTIQRIQRVFIQELKKIAIIHLFSMGFEDEDLINFDINMANPSTINDLQKLELWRAKFEVANMAGEGTLSKDFVYKRIFKLSEEEIEEIEEGKRKDKAFEAELMAQQQGGMGGMGGGLGGGMGGIGGGIGGLGGGMGGGGAMAGLPPPPGGEVPGGMPGGMPGGEVPGGAPPDGAQGAPGPVDKAEKDPNIQSAAPNELIKGKTSRKKKSGKLPDLLQYSFGTKKTAMDPKRTASELSRMVRAPFGEATDPEEKIFQKRTAQLKKFAEDLDKIDILKSARLQKTKKVLL